MGFSADVVNKIKDVLDAEIVSGQALDYVKKVYFGGNSQVTNLAFPFLWLTLGSPIWTESWIGAKDRKGAPMKIALLVGAQRGDTARPYGVSGDTTKRGILTIVDEVLNRLDAKRSTILSANQAILDMNLTVESSESLDEDHWAVLIIIEIKARFFSAGR